MEGNAGDNAGTNAAEGRRFHDEWPKHELVRGVPMTGDRWSVVIDALEAIYGAIGSKNAWTPIQRPEAILFLRDAYKVREERGVYESSRLTVEGVPMQEAERMAEENIRLRNDLANCRNRTDELFRLRDALVFANIVSKMDQPNEIIAKVRRFRDFSKEGNDEARKTIEELRKDNDRNFKYLKEVWDVLGEVGFRKVGESFPASVAKSVRELAEDDAQLRKDRDDRVGEVTSLTDELTRLRAVQAVGRIEGADGDAAKDFVYGEDAQKAVKEIWDAISESSFSRVGEPSPKSVASRVRELIKENSRLRAGTAEIQRYRNERASKLKENFDLTRELTSIRDALVDAGLMERSDGDVRPTVARCREVFSELAALRDENVTLRANVEKYRQNYDELLDKNHDLSDQLTEANLRADGITLRDEKNAKLIDELNERNSRISELLDERKKAQVRIAELEARVRELEANGGGEACPPVSAS